MNFNLHEARRMVCGERRNEPALAVRVSGFRQAADGDIPALEIRSAADSPSVTVTQHEWSQAIEKFESDGEFELNDLNSLVGGAAEGRRCGSLIAVTGMKNFNHVRDPVGIRVNGRRDATGYD